MTEREKAIVMAYTGYAMLTGDKLGLYYQYIEEKLGRPVMTHELAEKQMRETIHTLTMPDFVELCRTSDEPRVMTLQEVQTSETALTLEIVKAVDDEYIGLHTALHVAELDYNDPPVEVFGIAGYQDVRWLRDETYGKNWRCWTSCPTDEQMKAVKWDEGH